MLNQIKQQLSEGDIILLLQTLGSSRFINNYDHMIFQTVCHGGDSMKLYYYKNSRSFCCYTNCTGGFDIFELVSKVKQIDLSESIKYIKSFFNIGNDLYIPKGFGTSSITSDFEDEDIEMPIIKNSNILNNFIDYYCCEWINEGISIDAMKKYQIKYYLSQHKIVIPHFNKDGELIGLRGRALLQQDIDNGKKYMPIYLNNKPYTHSLRHNLYGLNFNKDAISRNKKCLIFEAEKSVIKADVMYGDNNFTVAIGGSNISKHHMNLLLELGVEEIVIAFDRQFQKIGDLEYEYWQKKILKIMDRFSELVKITVIWDTDFLTGYKDSPIDVSQETFEYLYKNRISFKEVIG